jgi:hypothetical protein
MSIKHFLKSARVGIAVALIVLVIGVAGEVAWLALGLPGVHWAAVAPRPTPERTPQNLSGIHTTILYDRSEMISESYADVSIVPTYILAAVGLIVGSWWSFKRDRDRTHRGQSGDAP